MTYQDNCFLKAIENLYSKRVQLGAFPPTIFDKKDDQSWEEFLSELEIAKPRLEQFCEGKSTLTIQKNEKEGTIFICADTNLL
ncbi:hypothetical protein [Vibrio diazotrophicus]|uniref:hypothetical protein n=1 Tax=Vibrio diazotrophicus TaxID=685 RepID=UPI0005AA9892|nr:hypothetical protein [Vibrio diazotrophicus]